jgi:multidrug efflux pump
MDAGSQNLQVRVAGAFSSVEELKRLPIRGVNPATGAASVLQLADIATHANAAIVDPPAARCATRARR